MIALCDPKFAPANVKLTSRRFQGLLIHILEIRKIIRLKTICKSFLHQKNGSRETVHNVQGDGTLSTQCEGSPAARGSQLIPEQEAPPSPA
jgi:hypothetical protein